jgi:hypothetical protein
MARQASYCTYYELAGAGGDLEMISDFLSVVSVALTNWRQQKPEHKQLNINKINERPKYLTTGNP